MRFNFFGNLFQKKAKNTQSVQSPVWKENHQDLFTETAPRNSPEVIAEVERLRPILDQLIFEKYRAIVWDDILAIKMGPKNFAQRRSGASGDEEPDEISLRLYKELTEKYEDFLKLGKLSPADEKRYVLKRTKQEMERFGACHSISLTKKEILKEKFGIEWYTPEEENPDADYE